MGGAPVSASGLAVICDRVSRPCLLRCRERSGLLLPGIRGNTLPVPYRQ
jgi:hypothetical protein